MIDSVALNVFLEVARRGSFAEAARHLNQPTTTLSRKVQQLETELGARLFHRTTRSMSLTEVGKRLLPKAELAAEALLDLKGEVDLHAVSPTGTLRISGSGTVLQRYACLFAAFCVKYPNVGFHFESSSRYRDLAHDGLDFAFRVGPLEDSSLIARQISSIRYVLVASPDFLNRTGHLKHPSDLINRPCIQTHVDGLLIPWRFSKDGEAFDLQSEGHVVSDDLHFSRQLAVEGAGLAYLPHGVAYSSLERGLLSCVLENWMPESRDLYLVYANRQILPFKTSVFLEFMLGHSRET